MGVKVFILVGIGRCHLCDLLKVSGGFVIFMSRVVSRTLHVVVEVSKSDVHNSAPLCSYCVCPPLLYRISTKCCFSVDTLTTECCELSEQRTEYAVMF